MINNDENMMSIGEITKALNITRKIILNYEAKGLIIADKKDDKTGNRFYTIDTLTQIRTIRLLQNLGLSLDEIYSYFNENVDMSDLIRRLETLRDSLNLNIEKLKERVKDENDFLIQVATIPEQTIYKTTVKTRTVEEKTKCLRAVAFDVMVKHGTDISKRMYFIEYPIDDIELTSYCVAIPKDSNGENVFHIEEEKALCIYYHGGYENLPKIRQRIIDYANENGIELTGICRHIFLEGPPQHTDPKKFITEVALLIK